MDTLQLHDVLDGQFGDTRPTTSDFIIVEEDDHEIIIEWHPDSVSVVLYLWSHTDFQEIVPDDVIDCQYYDNPTNPSAIDELPDKYVNTFDAVVQTLKEKYSMVDEFPNEETVCNTCFPSDEMLTFRTELKE